MHKTSFDKQINEIGYITTTVRLVASGSPYWAAISRLKAELETTKLHNQKR